VCRDEDYRSEPDGTNVSYAGYKPNIEELEMLLEAYFVQIDGTLNKLSHVRVVPFPMLLCRVPAHLCLVTGIIWSADKLTFDPEHEFITLYVEKCYYCKSKQTVVDAIKCHGNDAFNKLILGARAL
jgi:hypothetical protein